ncbi:MAG: fused MFS/spermidine synthase [Anaerolineales bacterium]|nr:fused MFS/spermidine synthase [Anaerolineales bacterium]
MKRYVLFSVFVSGMTTLAAEVAAFRLLGNIFGASNIVWASIIGLILLYLAAGYFIGGRWADRSPQFTTFFSIMAWGAFTTGLIPFFSRPVLLHAARSLATLNAPATAGAFVGAMVLFVVPVTLLGCLSPFAIRLLIIEASTSGEISGKVYALSTCGSLLGSFLPVLVFIPWVGTRLTYLVFGTLLLAAAITGLWRCGSRHALRHIWMCATLLGLGIWAARGNLRPVSGLLFEHESPYNLIQVVERNNTRYLLLNEGQGVHSVYHPESLDSGGTWEYYLTAAFFNAPPVAPSDMKNLAIIGLAAGTISRQYSAVFGDIPITGIEIDGDIIAAGRRFFGMHQTNLRVIEEDGRLALANLHENFSVIVVDAYRLPYIPWHLTTQEFFIEARAHLRDQGALAINVGRTATDRRLVDALSTTLLTVFPSVHVMDVPDTFNTILVATVQHSTPKNLAANLEILPHDAHPFLRIALLRGVESLRPTHAEGVVFTDDRAPVEQLTNSILLRYLMEGSSAGLPDADFGS